MSGGEVISLDEHLLAKEPTKDGVEDSESELPRLQSPLRSRDELYSSNISCWLAVTRGSNGRIPVGRLLPSECSEADALLD
jgi:hypothetical protein